MSEQPKAKRSTKSLRVSVYYYGRVQGVGFRYTTVSVAEKFPVTGFVRNEWDGSVCLVAEGPETALRGLLDGIQASSVGRHIRDVRARWEEATGTFGSFQVR